MLAAPEDGRTPPSPLPAIRNRLRAVGIKLAATAHTGQDGRSCPPLSRDNSIQRQMDTDEPRFRGLDLGLAVLAIGSLSGEWILAVETAGSEQSLSVFIAVLSTFCSSVTEDGYGGRECRTLALPRLPGAVSGHSAFCILSSAFVRGWLGGSLRVAWGSHGGGPLVPGWWLGGGLRVALGALALHLSR